MIEAFLAFALLGAATADHRRGERKRIARGG